MSLLSELEIKKAREMLEDIEDHVTLIVVRDSSDLSKDFEEFVEIISNLSEKIDVAFEKRELLAYPGIVLKKGDQENIVYHTLPVKLEFEPFIKTIVRLSKGETNLSKENLTRINKIEGEIITFVAQFCPHCAKVVEKVNGIAIANPSIKSYIIDVSLFPEFAQKYEVMSAPTVLINKKIKLVGDIPENELVEWLIKSNTDYRLDYFVKLLNDGRIDEVEAILVENPEDIEVLGEVLKRSEIMAKVGAMVLLERLFKKKPESVERVKLKIRELLYDSNSNVKQDAALILGKIGDSSDIPFLEKLLESENEEVKDAAKEAIEEIESRIKES